MRRKAKKGTLSWYKKELWTIFSRYVRERDGWKCFTCGRFASGSGMHAGHYITRAEAGLRLYFHERNVHAQCYHCNINLSGNSDVYNLRIIEVYGKRVLTAMRKLRDLDRGDPLQWTIQDYEKKIKQYKAKLKKICQKQQTN